MPVTHQKLPPKAYEHLEYPKWKFHVDGRSQLVEDEFEEEDLGNDWHDSPAAAKAAKEGASVAPEVQAEDRDALMARALELGLKPDPRTGAKKLREMIDNASS